MPIFKFVNKIIAHWLIIAFLVTSIEIPKAQAGEIVIPQLPAPGEMVNLSPAFIPAHLQGITIYPNDPLKFDFLIHHGDGQLSVEQKKQEYAKLIKYFLASLTIPDRDQWVNLSPYEHDRIITENFGKTQMGQDLLSQDYLLKQITSSLMYPESGLGKNFWEKVYQKAREQFHTTNIPVNTFNKVWIIPDQAIVYESGNTAYILKTHLKVMLEEDYLALRKNAVILSAVKDLKVPLDSSAEPALERSEGPQNDVNTLGSRIIRQIILPALEKEVNEGKNFALLRQIVNSMILATWYKKALKESLLGRIYADRAKTQGINQDPRTIEKIYQRYLTAFKMGVYNYIKDTDTPNGVSVPKKYFAGGFGRAPITTINRAMISKFPTEIQTVDFASISAVDRVTTDFMVSYELPANPNDENLKKAVLYKEKYGVHNVTIPYPPYTARFDFLKRKNRNWKRLLKVKWLKMPIDPLVIKGIGDYPIMLTVTNNARTKAVIRSRLIDSARKGTGLFIASGGGALQYFYKKIPSNYKMISFDWVKGILPWPVQSMWTLNEITRLKRIKVEYGGIDPGTQVFVAWNPNDLRDTPDRLHKKIEAGATGALTQPPLLWKRFKESMTAFRAKDKTTPIIVGVPVFSSAENVAYWLEALLGIDWELDENKEAGVLLRDFRREQRELTAEEFQAYRVQWTLDLIKELKKPELGVSGIHLMPMGDEEAFEEVLSRADLLPRKTVLEDIDEAINNLNDQGIEISYQHEYSLKFDDQRSRRFRESLLALQDAISQKQAEDPNFKITPFTARWNWIITTKNRQHFHPDIGITYIKDTSGQARGFELDVDEFQVRVGGLAQQSALFKERLNQALKKEDIPGIRLEPKFRPHSKSLSWQFNEAFWKRFKEYVEDYRKAIGGSPDIEPKMIEQTARILWPQLKSAVENDPDGRPFYYNEIGVASAEHIILLINEMHELAKKEDNGLAVLKRLQYVLTDFSSGALKKSSENLLEAGAVHIKSQDHPAYEYEDARIITALTNVENPNGQLEKYKGRILRYHATNVFDTLPADQIARRNGQLYHVNTRLFLPQKDFDRLVLTHGLEAGAFAGDLQHMQEKGVQVFLDQYEKAVFQNDQKKFFDFWKDLWKSLRLEEELVPVTDPSRYDFLENGSIDDFNMYVSTTAIDGLREVRKFLHPQGAIEIIDIFNRDMPTYFSAHEPVKYDGSQVLKLNSLAFEHAFPGVIEYKPINTWLTDKKYAAYSFLEIFADAAMDVTKGGIDLNPANLAMIIKRDGQGVPLPMAQQDWAQLSHIEGFTPRIREITPVTYLPIITELKEMLHA